MMADNATQQDMPPKEKSDVTEWIAREDANIPQRWKNIGKEVFSRKSLMFAAADDLARRKIENPISLAATDVFVEKAQKLLSRRALWNMVIGGITSLLTFGMILYASWWLFKLDIISEIRKYGVLD
jgi:hypothetical protein